MNKQKCSQTNLIGYLQDLHLIYQYILQATTTTTCIHRNKYTYMHSIYKVYSVLQAKSNIFRSVLVHASAYYLFIYYIHKYLHTYIHTLCELNFLPFGVIKC